MIRTLAVGMARVLFSLACITAVLAAALFFVSYRLVRFVLAGSPATPVRDAGLQTVVALATLGRALKERMPEQ